MRLCARARPPPLNGHVAGIPAERNATLHPGVLHEEVALPYLVAGHAGRANGCVRADRGDGQS
ncbi:hypothetical protein XAB3213_300042 [Xanthomonas citri pv. bilvae]|nr:hypothetical protein XAB3213_300042 [Xanthomonas citri pv. bilvae]